MDGWIDVTTSGTPLQRWLRPDALQGPLLRDRTRTLYLSTGTYTLEADAEVVAGVTVVFEPGAVIAGDVTLVVRGRIVAGEHTLFALRTGLTVLMVGRQTPQVTPRWWGARGDGRTADGAALAAMADSLRADGPSVVVFSAGVYLIDRTVFLPTGKRYVSDAPEGAVVLRRHGSFAANGPLALCGGSAPGRVTFKGLTFDGDGGEGPLLLCRPASDEQLFEVTVTGCAFMGSGATALEVWWGQGLWLTDCRFERCRVSIHARHLGGHLAVHGVNGMDGGGDVVLEGSVGSVASVADAAFSGRIEIKSDAAGAWDARIADSTCDGLGIDAEDCRVGVVGCQLRGASLADDTVVIKAARQVVFDACLLGLLTGTGKASRVGVRVRWRRQTSGAVLIHDCALSAETTGLARATAFEISDDGGAGRRQVDVIAVSVDGGFGLAASLIGARASFRQVEVQCAGAFRLERSAHGVGAELLVNGLRYMPTRASEPVTYLEVLASSIGGRPNRIRHDDVIIDSLFNLLRAQDGTLDGVVVEGARVIRGPVEADNARPEGMSGLVGDVFRPHNLLQAAHPSRWPTEWWCVRSGVQGDAVWRPVCRRPLD